MNCEANLSSTVDDAGSTNLNSMSAATSAEEPKEKAGAAIADALASKETALALSSAEEAKLKAEVNIAEASAAKETAEAVSSALADIDSLLASLLGRKRRQGGTTTALEGEVSSTAGSISAPTSCAAFADMMDQVITCSFIQRDSGQKGLQLGDLLGDSSPN